MGTVMPWVLAGVAGLGIVGGAWKLMRDTATAARAASRPRRPWDIS
ncbi:MAG TPA: hypothetical protein VEL76_00085 [Gemmataceae bacterium]|nr:hypothetical protein [Gemmataceae bacterium]